MSRVDKDGMLVDARVVRRRFSTIEHRSLKGVHAIVVHQTGAATSDHTFNSYRSGGNGAHFLIDKNGQIYQTASLKSRCYHVGRLIKAKCLTISKNNCGSAEMAKALAMSWTKQIKAIDEIERAKSYPHRYPVNSDSVGIEIVGEATGTKSYETVTPQQNASLRWLIGELYTQFGLTSDNVYRHPEVSYKNPDEASSATWK